MSLAEARGWSRAAQAARADYRRRASALGERLAETVRQLDVVPSHLRIQSPREILADVIALDGEFPEVEIDLKEQTLSLTTDPIVLEGIDLGRFRTVLHLDQLPDAGAYDVVALDPHPAASDEMTTHPHVRDEGLCEGEGRLPIRRAIQEGRLYDFGLLVRQVLETYNAGSAYVPLSRWRGNFCSECGYLASEDDSTSCEHCSSDLCLDCSSSCFDCGRCCCHDCRDRCQGCDEQHCSACLRPCTDCGESCCRGCLSGGRCEACREADDSGEPDDRITLPPSPPHPLHRDRSHETVSPNSETFPETEPSNPPLQPLRLGQAAVPA